MRAIGFRASPDEITYTVLDLIEGGFEIVSQGELVIPVSLDFPKQLNYIRRTFRDILAEYDVRYAGIRKTESMASRFGKKLSVERVSFEAILQELICSSTVEKYFVGQISNMSARLGIKSDECSEIIKSKKAEFKGINLSEFNEKQKESILIALTFLNR